MALNFPDTPTIGQVFPSPATAGVPQWRWDGSEWVPSAQAPAASAITAKVTVFTASGTYTPTPGMLFAVIECQGGGGAGGGVTGTTGNYCTAGGGAGGTYSRKTVSAATVGASQPVTVGAGGPQTSTGDFNGQAGTASSVGSLCTAPGGGGGGYCHTGVLAGQGGAPGAAGVGDVSVQGNGGGGSWNATSAAGIYVGFGGGAHFGGGAAVSYNSNGQPAPNYGGGGSGGQDANGTSNKSGGAGGPGVVVITEYGYFGGVADPGAVRYDSAQSLSAGQQTQARQNISVDYATKADQQTGTAANKVVTPAHQQDHDGSAKAWAMFTGSATNGAQTINAGYNVTSVTRVATGQYNVVFTTPFASAIYVAIGSNNGGTTDGFVEFINQTAGGIQAVGISKAGVAFDPVNGAYLAFFGRQ